MNAQQFDGLLMDHALGATTPEVAALIEALAQTSPDVQARLTEWRTITHLARRAQTDAPATLPDFARMELPRARRGMELQRIIGWGVGIAACVAGGFLISAQRHAQTPLAITDNPPAAVTDAPNNSAGDFWSVARNRALIARQTSPETTPANSPVTQWLQSHQL